MSPLGSSPGILGKDVFCTDLRNACTAGEEGTTINNPLYATGYEKGTISRFHFKTHNLESGAATDFNFGVMILTSSCYTHKEFHATPTFGLGRGKHVSQSCSNIAILFLTLG